MALYVRNGSIPAPLPFEAVNSNGELRTDLANHPASAAECGFVAVPDQPADTATKTAVWQGGKWVMVDKPTPPRPDYASLIEAEKVRRIEAGFPYLGKVIQSRAEDRENITGAKSAAQDAKLLGAEPGDLDWQLKINANGASVFAWITADNSLLPLDADQMIAMGYATMIHKQRLIFKGKSLKDRAASGEDFADVTTDSLWG